jgi:lipopolysaccharide/colanic/teichoic acid biosynthesis glycosyltransferase
VYKTVLKPFFDFSTAMIAFLVLSPIFLIVFFALLFVNKGTPFFVQKRPGKRERIFSILKFKTMTDGTDVNGNLLPDEKRLTAFGNFVRSTSLDELPQLINVIKGDMSIVGPRPLLPEYLALYTDVQKQRHDVKPGITGYAQVNGRNSLSWEKKFDLDVAYVQQQSFSMDISILIKTVKKVVMRSDINNDATATMTRFEGTQKDG